MTRLLMTVSAVFFFTGAVLAIDFEPITLTVPATSILEANELKGAHYTIADSVTVEGYMNNYTVDSEFGQFTAVGNQSLKKLLHEIDAIAELRKMTSTSTGTDAVVGVVTDTGKSVLNLAVHPVQSAKGISAGVSRFFKRTSRTAKNVSSEVVETVSDTVAGDDHEAVENADDDEPGVTTRLASSFMGIGKAQRELARELKVDPYSENAVLQTELARVANVAGTVGKISSILMPIPSVVGIATDVSDLVWNLSPLDLLIQNEEKLEALGYTDESSIAFFSNKAFSPTQQTLFVAALDSLDKVGGRDVLLDIAIAVESKTESEFVIRSVLLTQLYHQKVEPVTKLMSTPNGLVPVAVTESGDGLIFAPLDHLLWTEEIAAAVEKLGTLIDANSGTKSILMWIEGQVSDMALAQLSAVGWLESTAGFEKLKTMVKD